MQCNPGTRVPTAFNRMHLHGRHRRIGKCGQNTSQLGKALRRHFLDISQVRYIHVGRGEPPDGNKRLLYCHDFPRSHWLPLGLSTSTFLG